VQYSPDDGSSKFSGNTGIQPKYYTAQQPRSLILTSLWQLLNCRYYIGLYICVYVCMHVCVCVCVYARIYVCTYVALMWCAHVCDPFNLRCTHIFAIPSMYVDIISKSQELGLKITTLQIAAFGGAPCSRQLALQIKETLNIRKIVVSTRQKKNTGILLYFEYSKCSSQTNLNFSI
jgi:hypothetical protein